MASRNNTTQLDRDYQQLGSDVVVHFSGVTKDYGKVRALEDASFSVHQGDIFGYIGPNGAGKTTTIKILVGLIRDYRGEIYVNGVSLRTGMSSFHQMLGYLPQEAGFQSWRTVRQVLTTFGRLSGVPREQLNTRIDEVLETTGLKDEINRRVVHLSGGTKQKLRLAQALLHSPRLLLLDEPVHGLDPASRHNVKQVIKALARDGITIFVSSHILSDLENIATRVGVIHRGRILRTATPEQLRAEFRVGNNIEIIATCDEKTLKQIEGIEGVHDIERLENGRFIIQAGSDMNIDELIWKSMSLLINNRCSVSSIRVVQPSLEEAYLRLVGGE